ncbi:hypothetical protein Tco_0273006 [Tanacetum coccineum]
MDSKIPLGQKNTLAEYMILSGADNRPPILDKDLYDSWKSRMELYLQNKENGRMILESVENGPLIWPTIEEHGVIRTKKYAELFATEKIQVDCDMKSTNIILQGLPADIYSLVNHHKVAKDLWERVQLLMQVNQQRYMVEFPQIDSCLAVPVFKQGDDPIDVINKMMSFLSTIVASHFPSTNNQLRNSSNPRQQATIHDGRVNGKVIWQDSVQIQRGKGMLRDPGVVEGLVTQSVITHNAAYQADDLDAYDSDYDEISKAKGVLMANLSSYGSDVLSKIPISDNTNNDMLNQSVHEMPYSEPSHFVEHPENEIHSDSNIILYSQYLIESQNATVQDTNSSAQQDALILSIQKWVKLLEERQNVDLGTREKLIINDIIRDKNAQFADFEMEINSLKQTLSEQIKEKESLTKTFNVFKNKSKEKESRNIDKEIALEKKVKELDNIVCKMGQSAQTVHMITKPQVFYDNNLNQALGFQNPFYLKKAQQIRPMLYDGNVIAKKTNVISIADSEETLMLKEESRSKMLLKQSDPMVLEKKVNTKPIDYIDLNRLSIDFGKLLSHNENYLMNKLYTISLTNLHLRRSKLRLLGNFLSIKNDLRKLKGKEIADNAAHVSNATTNAPGMYKLDPVILAPKVKNNREAHEYYLKHTIEQAAILRELIQELLGYVRDTCPHIHKPSEKLLAVTPINKKKTVRFVDTVTSSSNIPKVTNIPLLSSTGVNLSTSASGSKPSDNTTNDRISRTPSSNEKNKVEVQSKKGKSSLNKRNSDSKNVCNKHVKHLVKGAKALCSICNECLFDANHAMCLIDRVNSMNVRAKSASKKNKKRKEWKPTGKVFNSVGYKWKPTGRTFTLVGNACPLTRLTATSKVPFRV